MSRVAELTASLDSITHKSTKDNNIERSGVGLSIGMRGYEGASIARPRHDTPPEGQSRATYKGAVKWLISLATGIHEMCHAGDQLGGDSRLLGGKARDISSQARNITP
ncbi:hypothetical protein Tco_0296188 [Tanacetum coccineum]